MAALLLWIATVISCVHAAYNSRADTRPLLFLAANSAPYFNVRVACTCGLPSAVQTIGLKAIPALANAGMTVRYLCIFLLWPLAAASGPAVEALGDVITTSKAALRPGTAAF
eukprot:4266477-Prorocentrum_lima.AAC.1